MSSFTVFLTQAMLLWPVSLAVQLGQVSPAPARLPGLDMAGAVVWAAEQFPRARIVAVSDSRPQGS